jgi:hypothetical protein
MLATYTTAGTAPGVGGQYKSQNLYRGVLCVGFEFPTIEEMSSAISWDVVRWKGLVLDVKDEDSMFLQTVVLLSTD